MKEKPIKIQLLEKLQGLLSDVREALVEIREIKSELNTNIN